MIRFLEAAPAAMIICVVDYDSVPPELREESELYLRSVHSVRPARDLQPPRMESSVRWLATPERLYMESSLWFILPLLDVKHLHS